MENDAQQNTEYALWNATDGIYAAPDTFPTVAAAEDYARRFRERYSVQGFYRTAAGQRIAPEDIQLEVTLAGP